MFTGGESLTYHLSQVKIEDRNIRWKIFLSEAFEFRGLASAHTCEYDILPFHMFWPICVFQDPPLCARHLFDALMDTLYMDGGLVLAKLLHSLTQEVGQKVTKMFKCSIPHTW